jgi:PAS domain S-box-containing protein
MPAVQAALESFSLLRPPTRRAPEPSHLSLVPATPAAAPPATRPRSSDARRAEVWTRAVTLAAAAVIAGCVAIQLAPGLASPRALAGAAVFVAAGTAAVAAMVAWRYVAALRTDAARLRHELDAARESERWHRAVVNDVAQAVLVASPEGRLLETNQAAWALLGRSREELAGRRLWDLLPLDERVLALRRGELVVTHGGGLRRLLRPDGSVVLADVSWSTLDDGRLVYLARPFQQ